MTAAAEMRIQGALDAVSIRSATSFSWFGDLSPNLSAVARRAMTGPATRDYLCYQLQMRLYRDFYCKGSATPGGEQRNTLRRTPTTPFIEALSAANMGTGAREGGWSVVNVAQNSGSDRCFAGLSWASAKLVDVRKEGKTCVA